MKQKRKSKYNFESLDIGDSFIVELDDSHLNWAHRAMSISACGARWARLYSPGRKFRVNTFNLSQADTERPSYIRVTRVK